MKGTIVIVLATVAAVLYYWFLDDFKPDHTENGADHVSYTYNGLDIPNEEVIDWD